MAKLIYSSAEWASASNATDGALRNYADSGDIFYKTLIFTKDGFLVTHGKVFRMVDTESLTASVTIDISSATGKVTLTDGFNGKQSVASLPVWKLTQGDYLTINNSAGDWTISHKEPDSSNNENITTLSTVFADYVLTKHIDNIVFDKWGHIQSYKLEQKNLHLDYVTQEIADSTYYLLGGTNDEATTYSTVKNPDVYVQKDASAGWQIVTPSIYVKGTSTRNGLNNIILGTTSGTTTSLYDVINTQVNEAKTQALMYKGTLDASNTTESSPLNLNLAQAANGDTYKIAKAGFVQLGTADSPNVQAVKPGDVLIINKTSSQGQEITTVEYIPSGDEQETSIAVDGNAADFGVFTFKNDSNNDFKAFSYDSGTKTLTFTNTTYKNFIGYGITDKTPAAGLVPAPSAANQFLSSNGNWTSIKVGEGIHTISIGRAPLSGEIGTYQNLSASFGANSSDNVVTYIPLATEVKTDALTTTTWGAIIGNVGSKPTNVTAGWENAKVVDGIVQYYNHVWSVTPTYNGTGGLEIANFNYDGTTTSLHIKYADYATKENDIVTPRYGVVGSLSEVTDSAGYLCSPIINGIVYYQNTWRKVNCWGIDEVTKQQVEGNISTNDLNFSKDFVMEDSLYITWAEVSEDGKTITYTH